jgi:hypothetical protein
MDRYDVDFSTSFLEHISGIYQITAFRVCEFVPITDALKKLIRNRLGRFDFDRISVCPFLISKSTSFRYCRAKIKVVAFRCCIAVLKIDNYQILKQTAS